MLCLFLESCSNFSNNDSNNLVARAGEYFLYEDDLPNYVSSDDSLIKISNFIETWAKEKVLYDLSIINLSQLKRAEIDELVNNYRVDLYINSYKDLIVNSRIDSIVTNEQIDSFYSMNLNNFKLNENLVKYRYVKVPDDNLNINRIRRYILRMSEQDRYFLDSLNFQFADLKLDDSIWFTERDVIASINFINQSNKSRYFIKDRLFTIDESNYINFFIVDDMLKSGNIPPKSYPDQWDLDGLKGALRDGMNLDLPVKDWANEEGVDDELLTERIEDAANSMMTEKTKAFGKEAMQQVEKQLLLQTIDTKWREHLITLEHLRSVVGFRGYAQRDPLNEYKNEAFQLFERLLNGLRYDVTKQLSMVRPLTDEERKAMVAKFLDEQKKLQVAPKIENTKTTKSNSKLPLGAKTPPEQMPTGWQSTGRNEICPCGSGKKFKHCHGRL